ncbi:hypothetical protein A2482_04240 [Candidatus Falkowbacteria bacterium RIFOXYC2_FULL_48_21]|uniref:Uncharacterized protein n=1 Tax=Candidatus Falkowbacteria bacterium RIFOXYC2_FULL_48_21 TaxID=1798005 RepID=A0A1F5TGW4_9BACT|nr:MAG: hypothetical protein A2482_04240 [Candidatus Falkowbacteria bacterium RIFOXYC2_FULL_48_21]
MFVVRGRAWNFDGGGDESGCGEPTDGDKHSKRQTTEAQHAECRAAEFNHAAMRICASDGTAYFYCLYCVDKRGVMYPFEDKTE